MKKKGTDKVRNAMAQDKKQTSKVIANKKPKMTLSEFKKKTQPPKTKDRYVTKEGKATLKGKGRKLVATKRQQEISSQIKQTKRQFGF